jgi:hypothetical protein
MLDGSASPTARTQPLAAAMMDALASSFGGAARLISVWRNWPMASTWRAG